MNRKEKRQIIGESIDLGNGRFKEHELDTLLDIATNFGSYSGQRNTERKSFTDWCSDGKYSRTTETTYSFDRDDSGIFISEDYSYKDNDGDSGSGRIEHRTARDILSNLSSIFGNKC